MKYAMLLSVLAGLATGLGGLAAALLPTIDRKSLGASMGFAAGVMLCVSGVDMLPHAVGVYSGWMSPIKALGAAASLFVLGGIAARALSGLLPDPRRLAGNRGEGRAAAARTALVVALALAAHNLPEGMLTLLGGLENPAFGLRLAVAVALHNIPEGIAVSVPMAYASRSRWKGAVWALASGLAEPAGAIAAALLFRGALGPGLVNGSIAFIAGLMSGVSVFELLPGGLRTGGRRAAWLGVLVGAGGMLLGIWVLGD